MTGHTAVPTARLVRLMQLADPEPIVVDGKVHVFKNPDAAEVLRLMSAELRAMLDEAKAADAAPPFPARYLEVPRLGERGFDSLRYDLSELDVELRAILASVPYGSTKLDALHQLLRRAVAIGAAGGK
jgi:hypothetical protein